MSKRILLLITSLILISAACNTRKKTTNNVSKIDDPAIQLDTIRVTANEPPKKEIYRESHPRLTDIIHTRLDVSFNWQKSQLNGKATILAKPHFYATNKLFLDARGMEIKSVEMLTEIHETP